jgi:quercetin dioxygenase-like cupin family protein
MRTSEFRIIKRWATLTVIAALSHLTFAQTETRTTPIARRPRARVAITHSLQKLNGNRLHITVLEVSYGPGESSLPHSHPCPVIGYVTEGSIRTQVKGQPESVIKTGGSFYEAPHGVHLVSANASLTEPASFLAFFVCDHAASLSSELSSTAMQGGSDR